MNRPSASPTLVAINHAYKYHSRNPHLSVEQVGMTYNHELAEQHGEIVIGASLMKDEIISLDEEGKESDAESIGSDFDTKITNGLYL